MTIWRYVPLLSLLLLAACSEQQETPFTLTPAHYAQLPNWEQSDHSAALTAFLHSCSTWKNSHGDKENGCSDLKLQTRHWQAICEQAMQVDTGDTSDVRHFFETQFTPHHVVMNGQSDGLFTGYYIPEIRGSLTRGGNYQTPVYGLPEDIKNGQPYYSRAEIYAGKLEGRGLEIAWVDDAVGLFFIEVQGSGVIRLAEGGLMTIGFAGRNHHPYVAIGRTMEKQGLLAPGNVNLFTIKDWLYDHPARAKTVMSDNPSYIFFRKLPDHNIRGAQNAPLTAQRSLAVDWRYIPYGMPIYLQTDLPETRFGPSKPFHQLMIAQDTGSAIKGGIRGDIYFGHGKHAEALASKQATQGRYTLLLPNPLAERLDTSSIQACVKK